MRLSGGKVECGDAGEDEIDPGEELLAVVVLAHLVGDGPGGRVVVGVERVPGRRHGVGELAAVTSASMARPFTAFWPAVWFCRSDVTASARGW
ncbi:hypothetical protein [Amycolatopsis sp. cmx-8-4]|uniref:hypothetical protein n=1 Tax=Amycolatopsis sp. cmx-8-4 TaxID=2790947 RepID=UPI00397DAED6